MTAPAPAAGDLAAAIAAARRRLWLRACADRLRRLLPWLLAAIAAAAALRLAGLGPPRWSALAVPAGLAAIAIAAWLRRPSPAAAAARWDAAAGRRDDVLCAWDFSRIAHPTPAMAAHLALVARSLPAWRARIPADLPLGLRPLAAGAPLALLALLASGLGEPTTARPAALSAEAAARLAAETRAAAELPTAAGMDAGERARAEALREKLAEAAKQPERDETAALEKLDRLAKEAEQLAKQLDPGALADAATLAELAKLADLAALAQALELGDLERAAQLAAELAKRLASADTSLDEQRRLAEALRRAAGAGAAGELGAALAAADAALQAGDRAAAGEALGRLGKQLARAGARRAAGQRMQQVAQRLRGAGARALAQGAQVARIAPGAGLRPFDPDLPVLRQPLRPGRGGDADRPPRAYAPGRGRGAAADGQGPPVPGSGDAGMAGGGAGGSPVPGSDGGLGMLALGAPGGSRAGRGHAESTQAPTAARRPTGDGTVDAAIAGGAAGETRLIAGGDRREGAAVARQPTPAEILAAEEQALDGDALPASRREQVKAYFHLVRTGLDR